MRVTQRFRIHVQSFDAREVEQGQLQNDLRLEQEELGNRADGRGDHLRNIENDWQELSVAASDELGQELLILPFEWPILAGLVVVLRVERFHGECTRGGAAPNTGGVVRGRSLRRTSRLREKKRHSWFRERSRAAE